MHTPPIEDEKKLIDALSIIDLLVMPADTIDIEFEPARLTKTLFRPEGFV